MTDDKEYWCQICGRTLPDYEPQWCCNGTDCGCRGLPINAPYCDECWNILMSYEETSKHSNG